MNNEEVMNMCRRALEFAKNGDKYDKAASALLVLQILKEYNIRL